MAPSWRDCHGKSYVSSFLASLKGVALVVYLSRILSSKQVRYVFKYLLFPLFAYSLMFCRSQTGKKKCVSQSSEAHGLH